MEEHTFHVKEKDSFGYTTLRIWPYLSEEYTRGLTDKELLQLTLQKWESLEGFLIERKQKIADGRLHDYEWRIENGGIATCALCMRYILTQDAHVGSCAKCPVGINLARGCDIPTYKSYVHAENVDSAIAAARGCQDLLRELLDDAG